MAGETGPSRPPGSAAGPAAPSGPSGAADFAEHADALWEDAEALGAQPVACDVVPCPEPVPSLRLHLDADRDGRVDDDTSGLETWTWGPAGRGAIVLCNNDDDNTNRQLDNDNRQVDTNADVPDLAPLVLRRTPTGLAFPAGYKAYLSVSDRRKLRVFERRSGTATEIIGPNRGARYRLPDLGPEEFLYGMEALQYPDRRFDGLITITLEVKDPTGSTVETHRGVVRVAPWLMFTHLDPTETVYVAEVHDNATFRGALDSAVTTGTGVSSPTVVPRRWSFHADRWMQDVMELGYSSMPRVEHPGPNSPEAARWHLPAVMRTANDRAGWGSRLDAYTREGLLGPDFGYLAPQSPMNGSSLDSFGNLECSPPVRASGVTYKMGRIIYGNDPARPMAARVRQFLTAQRVQAPFALDTSWLAVGHVDEFVSFCPLPSAADEFKRFRIVLASPALAVRILEDLQARGEGRAPMFVGINPRLGYRYRTPDAVLADDWFVGVQRRIQARIDRNETVLRTQLGMTDPADVVPLPVLFQWDGDSRKYVAYTPGVVNMLVVTRADQTAKLVIPKPFGPEVGGDCQFEAEVRTRLAPTGNDIEFVDDFTTYHHLMGEIHCGTNSKRLPPTNRWWWEQEGL